MLNVGRAMSCVKPLDFPVNPPRITGRPAAESDPDKIRERFESLGKRVRHRTGSHSPLAEPGAHDNREYDPRV